MQIQANQKAAFVGKRYTIDTFPEDPEGETHEVALLQLSEDGFQLEGEVYGVHYPADTRGSYQIKDGFLDLDADGDAPDMQLEIGSNGPEHFWPGRDIDIKGLPQWDKQQITFHRVPDPQSFQGELSQHERNLLGHHEFESPRMGSFSMHLNEDRSGTIQGELNGKDISWNGRWLSTHPMSYFVMEGTDQFLAWHNNHDHGNHDNPNPDPIKEIKDMPVDVIVTTTGENSDIRKVYGMVMNPTGGDHDHHHHS